MTGTSAATTSGTPPVVFGITALSMVITCGAVIIWGCSPA